MRGVVGRDSKEAGCKELPSSPLATTGVLGLALSMKIECSESLCLHV